jgi:uncharacterized membrane protein YbhN (UPF0104 family)
LSGSGRPSGLLRHGDVRWLALGVVLEALSYAGAIVLLHGVFDSPRNRIGWRASYQITVAGAAAKKVLAAAGAGGIMLWVWALRAYACREPRSRTGWCYAILDYGVYLAAIAVAGFGCGSGSSPVTRRSGRPWSRRCWPPR